MRKLIDWLNANEDRVEPLLCWTFYIGLLVASVAVIAWMMWD